jgi:hypothetical protein
MSEQYIEVTVGPDGSVTAKTHNLLGSKCLDYIAVLEHLLDAETTSSAYTTDYHRSAISNHVDPNLQTRNTEGA